MKSLGCLNSEHFIKKNTLNKSDTEVQYLNVSHFYKDHQIQHQMLINIIQRVKSIVSKEKEKQASAILFKVVERNISVHKPF